MNASVICVGKLKETWQREGVSEYLTRLSRYGRYDIIEVDDERDPIKPSAALIKRGVDKEGERILKRISPSDYVICLCINAPSCDSVELSAKIGGLSRAVFVIGGSNGLSEAVLARANEKLSFSRLTFPHGLMRVILLEQLYRAESILSGEKYHK